MTWKHKSVEINFSETHGTFYADVKGESVEKPSLAAMKKFIDDSITKANEFVKFNAVRWKPTARWSDTRELESIEVVGIKQDNRRGQSAKFILANNEILSHVILDTPETREAMVAAKAYRDESNRIETERRAEQNHLESKITDLNPKSFNLNGTLKDA